MTPEAKYWQAKLDDLNRTELDTVQVAAGKWQSTISTLLGIFGAVAFVSGTNTLEKLPEDAARGAKYAVLVAVILALLAILAATYAAQGVPRRETYLDWKKLQTLSQRRAGRALVALRISQLLAVLAALVVVAGSLVVLFGTQPKSEASPYVLVKTAHGEIFCGTLAQGPVGLVVAREAGAPVPLDSAMQTIVSIQICPHMGGATT
jgi:hypothetical protein